MNRCCAVETLSSYVKRNLRPPLTQSDIDSPTLETSELTSLGEEFWVDLPKPTNDSLNHLDTHLINYFTPEFTATEQGKPDFSNEQRSWFLYHKAGNVVYVITRTQHSNPPQKVHVTCELFTSHK